MKGSNILLLFSLIVLLISIQLTCLVEGHGEICKTNADCPKPMICSPYGIVHFCQFRNPGIVTPPPQQQQQVLNNGIGMKQIEKRVALKLISKILDQLIDQE